MKTELKMSEHGDGDVQILYNGVLIGSIAGSEVGPGVQVISHHPMLPQWHANGTPSGWRFGLPPSRHQPNRFHRKLPMSWLRNALHKAVKPKQSIIGVLKQHLGGPQPGRSMKVLHASDVTKTDFCPKKWALFDLFEKDPPNDTVATAMDVTYQMGLITESLLVEHWAGDAVVGNWRCRHCGVQRSMTTNPGGYCAGFGGQQPKKHWWQHLQIVVSAPDTGFRGALMPCSISVLPNWW